ncbi:hypothetical protein LTR16_009122, partial [Cryomyces antarcticus]
MPRKQFIADLKAAAAGTGLDGIHGVVSGEDDGQFRFLFALEGSRGPVSISASIPDVSEYPSNHEYWVYADDDAPPAVGAALNDLPRTNGMSVTALLGLVSRVLIKSVGDRGGDVDMPDS